MNVRWAKLWIGCMGALALGCAAKDEAGDEAGGSSEAAGSNDSDVDGADDASMSTSGGTEAGEGEGGTGTPDDTSAGESAGGSDGGEASESESGPADGGSETGAGSTWSDGPHLLVLATSINPDTPFQALLEVSFPTADEIAIDMQWLSLEVGSTTEPRQPFGATLQWTAPIAADGSFDLVIGELEVPGEANPITGTDLVGEFELQGSLLDRGGACGIVIGQLTSPLNFDLEGSTFAALPLADAANLPAPEPGGCVD